MAAPELADDQSGVFNPRYWEEVKAGIDPTPIEELDPLSRRVDGVLELIDEVLPPEDKGDTPPPAVPAPPHVKRDIGKMTLMGLKDGDAYGRPRLIRRIR